MNYYEELGVSQEATEQEIRKAHRRLVKLMHPDAQPDQSMKMLAETQMRRLNSIVSTLLDPSQRRSYDEQLHAAHTTYRSAPAGGRISWRGIPWWFASAGLAVVVVLAAVYMWADHMESPGANRANHSAYSIPPENGVTQPTSSAPSDPDHSKPLGASYTPPVATQPPPSVSDQPKPDTSKSADQRHPNEPHAPNGISATVVTDSTPAAHTPMPAPPVKQAEALTKTQPQAKPEAKQPIVAAANHPVVPPVKTVTPPKPSISEVKKPEVRTAASVPSPKLVARNNLPLNPSHPGVSKTADTPASAKMFSMPPGSLVARVSTSKKGAQLPTAPHIVTSGRDYGNQATLVPGAALPSPAPPNLPTVMAATSTGAGYGTNPRDPLEGEWVYAPKEPERHRAGFYPPEYIDLKLFGSGDPGSLKGQYSAKYVVTDRPVSPEVTFELASSGKGSRKFLWQSNNGARGTMSIDTIDDRTIRVDWHTTSAVHGPALTSGTATLVRRQ